MAVFSGYAGALAIIRVLPKPPARPFMPRFLSRALILLLATTGAAHAATEAAVQTAPADAAILDAFLKFDTFDRIKLSPDGTYLAITVPQEDKTVLVTMTRADLKVVSSFALRGKAHVNNFWWVSNKRLVFSLAQKDGRLERPLPTGELYATDVDGNRQTILTGYRSGETQNGHIKTRDDTNVYSEYAGRVPGDENFVFAAVSHPRNGDSFEGGTTSLDKVDVVKGLRTKLTMVPMPFARFTLDHAGVARFAVGQGEAGFERLYYRAKAADEWQLMNDEEKSGVEVYAHGFKADDSVAYLESQEADGPNGLYAFDVATGQKKLLNRDGRADPYIVIYAHDDLTPIAFQYSNGKPHTFYIDDQAPEARVMRSLQEQTFTDESVTYVNGSRDGTLLFFAVDGDRDPGSYYLYDANTKKANMVIANMDWLNPAALAEVKPIEFKSRDGQLISGLLTIPQIHGPGPMPMIVNPHGGPDEVADHWGFDFEPQMLAAHGYAVLQVNYRGSSNYGRNFILAGQRQWGSGIQDDITDAARWAVSQGYADAKRMCIYGADFGAYSALLSAAREPTLYRCAAGYVGVYNLTLMRSEGETHRAKSGRNYLDEQLGNDPAVLAAESPTNLAAQIKIPVFLAAGGQDVWAPKVHSEQMRDSLTRTGNPPEWLYFPSEGHGYYTLAHQREFYQKLFAFFDRSLGAPAAAGAAGANKSP
jgi:dipeptidyl aminopeptidase/acylaminoacyl peptidase